MSAAALPPPLHGSKWLRDKLAYRGKSKWAVNAQGERHGSAYACYGRDLIANIHLARDRVILMQHGEITFESTAAANTEPSAPGDQRDG